MYRDRNTGVGLFQIPSIDISVIIAMFILIVMAWGVSRMERSMVQAPKLIPVFTISQELAVTPAAETATKKGAARVGGFMSLAQRCRNPRGKDRCRCCGEGGCPRKDRAYRIGAHRRGDPSSQGDL